MPHKLILAGALGGTNFRAALVDPKGRVSSLVSERIPAVKNPRSIVALMASGMKQSLAGGARRPDGFALSLKGLVDPKRGLLKMVSDFTAWKDVPLINLLAKPAGLPG